MSLATKIALGTLLLASAAAAQEAVQEKAKDPNAALVERLGDDDFAERTKAYDALRAAGRDAREALRAGARSEDPEVKWSCRRLLRLLEAAPGEGEARSRLPAVLHFGGDPDLPRAVRALKIHDDEDFRRSLEGLRERMESLERDLDLRTLDGTSGMHAITEKDGERVEVRRDESGRLKVTLSKRGEDGREATETFEAENAEALAKEHPEVHAKVKDLLGNRIRIDLRESMPLLDLGKPVLGVGVSPVPPVLRTQMELPEDEGIVVEEVRPDSLAARLDVRRHDVILRVNGVPVSTAGDVRASVEAVKEGGEVRLDALRAGKKIVLTGTR